MCSNCYGIHYPDVTCEEHQAELDQIREPSDLVLNAYTEQERRKT